MWLVSWLVSAHSAGRSYWDIPASLQVIIAKSNSRWARCCQSSWERKTICFSGGTENTTAWFINLSKGTNASNGFDNKTGYAAIKFYQAGRAAKTLIRQFSSCPLRSAIALHLFTRADQTCRPTRCGPGRQPCPTLDADEDEGVSKHGPCILHGACPSN